jgi:hypothetical protein
MPAQQHGPLQGLRLGGNPFPIPPFIFGLLLWELQIMVVLLFGCALGWSAVDRGVDYDVVLSMCLKRWWPPDPLHPKIDHRDLCFCPSANPHTHTFFLNRIK